MTRTSARAGFVARKGRPRQPQPPTRSVPRRRPRAAARPTAASPSRTRFLKADAYRAEREWSRYEGTPQRDLFVELRERFLTRNAVRASWILDVGSGPGRFTARMGGSSSRRVALDLSRSMLRLLAEKHRGEGVGIDRVQGDGLRPPLAPGRFGEVALLGNGLGFAGPSGPALLSAVETLVAPGGILIVEIGPGSGERARYLHRLPPRAVARLLEAPLAAILPRLEREGFAPEAVRHEPGEFRRWTVAELRSRWRAMGWEGGEAEAIAPALGADPERIAAVASRPPSWRRLLELEEAVGHREPRWALAASVLVSVRAPGSKHEH